jgi:creatinine amidohydrolase
MKRLPLVALMLLVGLSFGSASALAQQNTPADMNILPNPIATVNSVWIEELSVLDVRDAIRGGVTTALIMTGGIEENGPYTSTDKHNQVLRAVDESIARRLGNTLVTPVITIEPGNPAGNVPLGTVFLAPETFRAVLRDYATSLKTLGFRDIIMIGDNGGNQRHMDAVAKELTAEWGTSPVHVMYIPEYYREDPWSCEYLRKELNVQQQPPEVCSGGGGVLYHDDYHYAAILMTIAPEHIKIQQRWEAGLFSVNGVDLDPFETTVANGWKLIEHRTNITVRAIQKARGGGALLGGLCQEIELAARGCLGGQCCLRAPRLAEGLIPQW